MTDPIFDYWMSAFERMKPFVDEGWNGVGWKPSELLVIGYSIVATGKTPKRADAWATMMLTKARHRYREGFSANPFSPSPGSKPNGRDPKGLGAEHEIRNSAR